MSVIGHKFNHCSNALFITTTGESWLFRKLLSINQFRVFARLWVILRGIHVDAPGSGRACVRDCACVFCHRRHRHNLISSWVIFGRVESSRVESLSSSSTYVTLARRLLPSPIAPVRLRPFIRPFIRVGCTDISWQATCKHSSLCVIARSRVRSRAGVLHLP